MTERTFRLFVSSPGDVAAERRRVELVVERLNAEFAGRARYEAVRWEQSYYSAHDTFQKQIPEAVDCDLVVAIFRSRLGTPLPPSFPRLPSGEPYPSGTAYEILSAIEVRRAGKRVPDVYVFRYPDAPSIALDAPDRAEVEQQWGRLKGFFDRWFRTESGEFLAAFQTYGSTDDFAAKLEDCLRQWLAQRGIVAQGPVWDRVLLGSPFPGLHPFEAERGRVFFGRGLPIAQALGRLRAAPFLLLIGASGSGKSSLLRAGLLPRLVRPGAVPDVDLWRVAVATPGPDPFASLADALFAPTALADELRAGTFRTPGLLARQLAADPDVAIAPLRDALDRAAAQRQRDAGFDAPRPARLALGIDQAERLFTEAPPAAAAAFAALLAALVRGGLATLVMALRSDAYPLLQAVEPLVALREEGATLDLLPPTPAELEEIVSRPVAACVPPLAFEPGLAARLVEDARGGDALPLLQVSLARLYAAEERRGDGVLRAADYRGMDDAVTQTANEALAAVDAPARAELPALVAGLVSDVVPDPRTGAPVPVVAALDRAAFEAGSPARAALVEAFVAKRLLTAAENQVRPVHESLLRIWPEAVAILADAAALIRVRHTLTPLVRAWAEADAKDAHLDLSPALLDGAQALFARFGPDLPPPMRDFIAQAAARDAARRDRERLEAERRVRDAERLAAANKRIARRTLGGLAAAVLLAALAGWQWHEAGLGRDRARRSLALATQTANGLVVDLAEKFRDVAGAPTATVKDMLDRARKLQDQLLAAGEGGAALHLSYANTLLSSSQTLLALGDTAGALLNARQGRAAAASVAATDPANAAAKRLLAAFDDRIGTVLRTQGDLPGAAEALTGALSARRALAESQPNDTAAQRDVAATSAHLGEVQQARGALPDAQASYAQARDILARLHAADSADEATASDLADAIHHLGGAQLLGGNLAAARQSYADGLALEREQAAAHPLALAWQTRVADSEDSLGETARSGGDLAAALDHFEQALAIRRRLTELDPDNTAWTRVLAAAHGKIGSVRKARGDLPAALASYGEERAILQRLTQADPGNTVWQRDLLWSLNDIGDAHVAQDALPPALDAYRAALAIAGRLAAADPGNADWQRDLSAAHQRIGNVQLMAGDLPGALQSFKEDAAVSERLAVLDPSNAQWQIDLALADAKLGIVRSRQGDVPGALDRHRAALAILLRLTRQDGGNTAAQSQLAMAHNVIAELLEAQGDLPAAADSFREALAASETLAALDPSNADWQHALAVNTGQVARIAQAQGNLGEAQDRYGAMVAIGERLRRLSSAPKWTADLVTAYKGLGAVQRARNDLPGALTSYQAAAALQQDLARQDPAPRQQLDLARLLNQMADVQQANGDPDAALATRRDGLLAAKQAVRADPRAIPPLLFAGAATTAIVQSEITRHDLPGALATAQSAHDWFAGLAKADPANAEARHQAALATLLMGDVRLAARDPATALAQYATATAALAPLAEAAPDNALWQNDMAILLFKTGLAHAGQNEPANAAAAYRKSADILRGLLPRVPAPVAQTLRGELALVERNLSALAPAL